jgi:hypothetical protein
MNEPWYVAVDRTGVEHTPTGHVRWLVPSHGADAVTTGDGLVLRRPVALLDVLEEQIFEAEPLEAAPPQPDGTLCVDRARLVAQARWDTETATLFALDCADHCETQLDVAALPDGTPLAAVLSDARRALGGMVPEAPERLGYLARLWSLRRLHHERAQLADLQQAVIVDDERRNRDAFDDSDYADLLPITDSVLAAVAALHHHLLPHLARAAVEVPEELGQHHNEDRTGAAPSQPTLSAVTPFGSLSIGDGVLLDEPAWTAAREAARHARLAVRDRGGARAEGAERAWQAERLGTLLRSDGQNGAAHRAQEPRR